MISPPAIEVTSPSSGSKTGLYGSQANQVTLLDSLKTAKVINSKLTPLRHKFSTGLFAASIIGRPDSHAHFDLSRSDESRLWYATAVRWCLWTSRQGWKSVLPISQRSSLDMLRSATRAALRLSFDSELVTEAHVDAFMPDFNATFDDVKSLRKNSKGFFEMWDWDHELSASRKQAVLEMKTGVKIKTWAPWGWSIVANTDDLRILMGAHIDGPTSESDGCSESEKLLL